MTCPRQPTCGSQGATTGPSIPTILADIIALGGLVSLAVTIGKIIADVTIWSFLGIVSLAAVWLAAIAGAVITFFIVFDFYRLRCLSQPATLRACSSGVIEGFVPSFKSGWDELFPFTAMHDRIDVVVQCKYWFLAENLAANVICNTDPDMSPILREYYKSAKVCGAGLGATIGAGIGAVAGIFLGVLAAGAIASALCGPLVGLCLILAMLIALIVAAVCVLVGALVGGQIGKAAAGGGPPAADDGSVLMMMDYVTTSGIPPGGGLVTSGDDDGARVYWFVTSTTKHGQSMLPAPHSHTDPDMAFGAPNPPDACPLKP
jgi:hypothetical protein